MNKNQYNALFIPHRLNHQTLVVVASTACNHTLISLPLLDLQTLEAQPYSICRYHHIREVYKKVPCLNYAYTGCMMQFHHGRWVGTSFLFIGGIKPTDVGFLLESTRKGRLIPGTVLFFIWRGRIFHSKFFSLKNLVPQTTDADSQHNQVPKTHHDFSR